MTVEQLEKEDLLNKIKELEERLVLTEKERNGLFRMYTHLNKNYIQLINIINGFIDKKVKILEENLSDLKEGLYYDTTTNRYILIHSSDSSLEL